MSRLLAVAWPMLALVALAPAPAVAQEQGNASLRVQVTDAATGAPIVGAQVTFPNLRIGTLTNGAGEALIEGLPSGGRQLEVVMLGYGTASSQVHIRPGAIASVTVSLTTEPIAIGEIVVEGRRRNASLEDRGFYERASDGLGLFLDEWQMDSLNVTRISHVLRRRSQPSCMNFGLATVQPLKVYLNGVHIEPDRDGKYPFSGGFIESVTVTSFAGIEYFNKPSEVPAGFDGECGVLLLWTK